MATTVAKLIILLACVPHASSRLLGYSFGLPIFDIFNATAQVTFDYIVVGAGTAGIPVAVRLAEAGRTVALIEAGSLHQLGNGNFSQVPLYASAFQHTYPGSLVNPIVDWNLTTTPQAGLHRLYPQGKAVGGTSTRSHQAFTFAPKSSYQEWANAVDDQSYTWEGFYPHLIKPVNFTAPSSYRFPNSTARYPPHWASHTSGPLQLAFSNYAWPWASWVKKALTGLGFEENPDGFVGGSLHGVGYQLSTLDTKETSDSSYLDRLGMNNENLVIYTNSLVTRILFVASKTANGVEIDYGGLLLKVACRKEVIVSAGAFRSPQLLMLSGIGPKATLEQHGIPVLSELVSTQQEEEEPGESPQPTAEEQEIILDEIVVAAQSDDEGEVNSEEESGGQSVQIPPPPARRRGRPRRRAPLRQFVTSDGVINTFYTAKEKADFALAVKLREEGVITTGRLM
ncbi:hypothetical protein EsH8_XII_000095 [Colletotrichum jinshuiense]